MTSPPKKQRRRAITDAEKKAIRQRWAELPAGHEQKSHNAIIIWFQDTYHHKISQSTVSEILSSQYARLDTYKNAEHPDKKRAREGNWPDLEAALNEW
jgi:hypothetical protein